MPLLPSFDIEIRDWAAAGAAEDIDYALVWRPEAGRLAGFPNLKLIFSLGAGVDHLMGDGIAPAGVPIVRMVDDSLAAGMTEFVVYNVLNFHRFMPEYRADQQRGIWNPRLQIPAAERQIGILGLGALGAASARVLVAMGFDVAGWSRREKSVAGVTSFYGDRQLADFLARSEILVCLLPLTAQTAGILCAENFAHLPQGACLINAARGGHCVESDLVAALDSGQIAAAALDVFQAEPPPKSSPLWRHPRVQLTPHIASMTLPKPSAARVMDGITRLREGRELVDLVAPERGY